MTDQTDVGGIMPADETGEIISGTPGSTATLVAPATSAILIGAPAPAQAQSSDAPDDGGTISLTGDVTGSGSSTIQTTIAAAAVTYAKMQNASASVLLGNPTGSAASPSEITLGAGLAFSGTTLEATGGDGDGTVTSVAVSGGSTGLTTSGGPITTDGTITLAGVLVAANGGTGVDNSETLNFGPGGTLTEAAFATPAALTASNDTNITVTLGGTPATALLEAASITMGWTGTLAVARGGTGGGSASGTLLDNISGFSSDGFLERTGAGTYSLVSSTGSGDVALASGASLTSPAISGSPSITGLSTPVNASDAATKGYVDATAQGLSVKPSAACATTTALPTYTYLSGVITFTATGTVTIDGHQLALGDPVLVQNETLTNAPNNGLYTVTTAPASGVAGVLTRSTSMNSAAEFDGAFVFVEGGTVNASAGFVCTTTGTVVIGTTNIGFQQFSGAGEITASTGLSKSGNTLLIANTAVTAGSYGSSTSIPSFTVNAEGQLTNAAGNAVVAPAGTLSGTTLNSTVVTSSLTAVGALTSGTWDATTIAVAHGGTGQTSALAAFDALSPMTTEGDIIVYASGAAARLGVGPSGTVLGSNGTDPEWLPTTSPLLGGASNSSIALSGGGAITVGSTATLSLTSAPNSLTATENILVWSTANSDNWFSGVIATASGSTITVLVNALGGTGTHTDWNISISTPQTANAALLAYSTSSNAVGAGQLTFNVQAGQFFPVQGDVLITATNSPQNQMVGQVAAYNGTTLIVNITTNGVFGSGTFSAWSIYLVNAPTSRVPLYQMNGLTISLNSGSAKTFTIAAGSVRDSTDTIDLILPTAATLNVASATVNVPGAATSVAMTGTLSSSGEFVTGSGTTFTSTSVFGTGAGTITDWTNQLNNTGYVPTSIASLPLILIGTSASTVSVQAVTNNTALTTYDGLGAGAGTAFTRGGALLSMPVDDYLSYAVILAYNSSTGATSVFASSFTASGAPDLPAGYTYYRCLGEITFFGSGWSIYTGAAVISQALGVPTGAPGQGLAYSGKAGAAYVPTSAMPKVVYSGTITPTALGQDPSLVSSVTGLITFASPHNMRTGQSVILTGTAPTGLTTGQAYYLSVQSTTTLYLCSSYANAVAGTPVIPSTTTKVWSFNYLVGSNEFVQGLVSATIPQALSSPIVVAALVGGIGGTPGSTAFSLDFNIATTNALANTFGRAQIEAYSLVNSSAATKVTQWVPVQPATFTSTTLVQTTVLTSFSFTNATSATDSGTFAQQGTTPFTLFVTIWG